MKAIYLSLLIGLAACGTGADTTTEPTTETEAETVKGVVTDLSVEDVPLQVLTPEGQEVSVVWREEFGHIEVRAGEKFGLIITEETGNVGRKKADLERDLLQTHTFIQDDASTLIYKSQFPDSENLVFHHLYEVVQVGDRSFVVSDVQDGKFSQANVEAMAGAVTALVNS